MRYAEDIPVGVVAELGSHKVTAEEIIAFGRTYDPQPYHVSEEAGAESAFGGLIASGWNTAAIWMSLYVTDQLPDSSVEGSPGVDELRWLRPLRPGDIVSGTAEVIGVTPSLRHKEIQTLRTKGTLINSDGDVVMTLILHSRFRVRPQNEQH